MSSRSAPVVGSEKASATVAELVRDIAQREVSRIQAAVLKDVPEAVSKAARLRRGAGKDAAALPDLWGLIDLDDLFIERSSKTSREPERGEKAIYAAVTLWSLHQQSQNQPMHAARGNDLGAAIRSLMQPGEIDDPLRKRLVRTGSAATFQLATARLREIVQLLRREKVTLDYAQLAGQLYLWQFPGGAATVRRQWGRGFHSHRPKPIADASPDITDPDQEGAR